MSKTLKSQIQINRIDLFNELTQIKEKYGNRYFKCREAIYEASCLWGIPTSDGGHILEIETEVLFKDNFIEAGIVYAPSLKGHHLVGLFASAISGDFSYNPSIWDTQGFKCRSDAKLFGLLEIKDYFNRFTAKSVQEAYSIKRLKERISGYQTEQLGLFDE